MGCLDSNQHRTRCSRSSDRGSRVRLTTKSTNFHPSLAPYTPHNLNSTHHRLSDINPTHHNAAYLANNGRAAHPAAPTASSSIVMVDVHGSGVYWPARIATPQEHKVYLQRPDVSNRRRLNAW
jgi:hypothetical protein